MQNRFTRGKDPVLWLYNVNIDKNSLKKCMEVLNQFRYKTTRDMSFLSLKMLVGRDTGI